MLFQEPTISYRRRLPHIQPNGAIFFITYRLAGSIPKKVLIHWKSELEITKNRCQKDKKVLTEGGSRHFLRMNRHLDKNTNGPYWLAKPEIASIVSESIHHLDGTKYKLWAYCIMSNHVHVLFTHQDPQWPLFKIMQSHKSYTAKMCNRALGRSGPFWEEESYDHIVRSPRAFSNILRYILQNPVKAGIVDRWQDWPFSWCDASVLDT